MKKVKWAMTNKSNWQVNQAQSVLTIDKIETVTTGRINNAYKNVYHLPKSSRSAPRLQVRLFLTNIVQHAALWLRKAKESLSNSQLLQACLDKLGLTGPTPHPPPSPPTPRSPRPLRPKTSNLSPATPTAPVLLLNTG